jgi:hypothetical protein
MVEHAIDSWRRCALTVLNSCRPPTKRRPCNSATVLVRGSLEEDRALRCQALIHLRDVEPGGMTMANARMDMACAETAAGHQHLAQQCLVCCSPWHGTDLAIFLAESVEAWSVARPAGTDGSLACACTRRGRINDC